MDEQDNRINHYLIPANVNTKFEFIEGIGWYELKIILIACLVGTVIFLGLGLFKKTIYVDANNMPIEMTIGANEEELIPDEEGNIKKTIPLIPSALRAFAIIIPGAAAFFLVRREPTSGMSLIEMVNSAKEFKKRQKLYLYKYNSGSEG